ncbi:MAG: MmcQ/YjbR family DNA-binding protein [Dehalococcoidia bacterium]|nr:MmcQ/YjbR family DNA-binding protein [Dehalococcoidia bacterium]
MDSPLARLRPICLAYPEAAERGGQHAQFSVRGRTFAYYTDDHHGDGMRALSCKAAPGAQEVLVASSPGRFFVPPYLGPRGWVGLRLDLEAVDWDEVARLVDESYRLVAPKSLLRALPPVR